MYSTSPPCRFECFLFFLITPATSSTSPTFTPSYLSHLSRLAHSSHHYHLRVFLLESRHCDTSARYTDNLWSSKRGGFVYFSSSKEVTIADSKAGETYENSARIVSGQYPEFIFGPQSESSLLGYFHSPGFHSQQLLLGGGTVGNQDKTKPRAGEAFHGKSRFSVSVASVTLQPFYSLFPPIRHCLVAW